MLAIPVPRSCLQYSCGMDSSASVTLLTRLPVPGRVKSRLVPLLGDVGAAELQRDMGRHVARQLRILAATDGVAVEARITGGTPIEARHWLRLPAYPQGEGDLGVRQAAALRSGLGKAPVAAVIGGDCPTVTVPLMREVLAAAVSHGVAFMSAEDGGYCVLAVSSAARGALDVLDSEIDWGTSGVLAVCLDRFTRRGFAPALLGPCRDIDEPGDLLAWHAVHRAWHEVPQSLAVVVPVLDEAGALPSILAPLLSSGVRVIVADGGSIDGSADVARAAGATVIECARGRASQMNAGARAADTDALLFLHADTAPPQRFAALVLSALADPELLLGSFRFSLGATSPVLGVVEAGTRLRGSLLHLPYGDQGLFLRRVAFEALGGFPDLPLMEDYELVRRARRAGSVRVLRETAVTSDRRWRERGALRWTALNLATVARYHLGTSPEELAAWRARHSKR